MSLDPPKSPDFIITKNRIGGDDDMYWPGWLIDSVFYLVSMMSKTDPIMKWDPKKGTGWEPVAGTLLPKNHRWGRH